MNRPQTYSYWESSEWLQTADLLIIGGGIVGASTALFYKQKFPDREVLILDKGMMPEGASTRNAGFACIGSVSEHLADIKTTGEKVVFGRIERRWKGLSLLKETMGEEEIGYQPTGGHEIFTDQRIFDSCKSCIPEMNRQLQERIGVDEVYKAVNYGGYPAIYNRAEGAINSGKLMKNLHHRLSAKGVVTLWNCEVMSVGENRVKLNNGTELSAKTILLATNGFTSKLTHLPIKPARGYVFITNPIENLEWRGTFHFDEGYIYFRDVDNRLLIGGARNVAKNEEETDQFGVNPSIKKHLIQFASEILKLPEGWEIEQEWSGIMGMTENKEPIVKEISPKTWVAAGLSGMGIAIGMEVAKEVVEKLNE
ncbi:FAD-dependent oxidoreductase [soil metagenome]